MLYNRKIFSAYFAQTISQNYFIYDETYFSYDTIFDLETSTDKHTDKYICMQSHHHYT